jgi:hypothetical protein
MTDRGTARTRVSRLGELFGAKVYDADGRFAGRVHDVRLVREGPEQGLFGPGYRLQGLIVGPASIGDRLGFDRTRMHGPWALKALFARFHRSARFVEWPLIESLDEAEVRVNVTRDELPPVPMLSE